MLNVFFDTLLCTLHTNRYRSLKHRKQFTTNSRTCTTFHVCNSFDKADADVKTQPKWSNQKDVMSYNLSRSECENEMLTTDILINEISNRNVFTVGSCRIGTLNHLHVCQLRDTTSKTQQHSNTVMYVRTFKLTALLMKKIQQ